MEAIAQEPIMVDSGKYEMKPGTQRTYADMQNEIASTLANLAIYTARVKTQGKEHTIKTLPPDRGISWRELQERTLRIQAQTRKLYCRPVDEVLREINTRQQSDHSQPKTQRVHTV